MADALRSGKFDNGTEIIDFIYNNGKLYNKNQYFYQYGKLYKASSKFKERDKGKEAKVTFQRFGDLLLSPISGIWTDKDPFNSVNDAINDFFGAGDDVQAEIDEYNYQLRKNAMEVK